MSKQNGNNFIDNGKRISLPYGAIGEISAALGKSRYVVSRALAGFFDPHCRNIEDMKAIREYALKSY